MIKRTVGLGSPSLASMRNLQAHKIRELAGTLVAAGYVCLDAQARVLGLSRSTTWTILQAKYKNSGLSASVINRMLGQPQLPDLVRIKLLEYVEAKAAGLYGHNRLQLRRFTARLSLACSDRLPPATRPRRGSKRRNNQPDKPGRTPSALAAGERRQWNR